MRVVVSGGGTGGHITPILAVVQALRRADPTTVVDYIGRARSLEEQLATEAGITFHAISAGKIRRDASKSVMGNLLDIPTQGKNAADGLRIVAGVIQARRLIKKLQPDVVFCKGGFVAYPVGLAAARAGIPLIIHESDLIPGLGNKRLAADARVIAVGFEGTDFTRYKQKVVVTGNPIADYFFTPQALKDELARLDLSKPLLVVTGGSQGAQRINGAIAELLPGLVKYATTVHICGTGKAVRLLELKHQHGLGNETYQAHEFVAPAQMSALLQRATVAVARAGVGTIAELAACGVPTILVPHTTMAGHQRENAQLILHSQAAVVVDEQAPDFTQTLGQTITSLLDNAQKRKILAKNIRRMAPVGSAGKIAEIITNVASD